MANQEQLERLLEQGVQMWNEWRRKNPHVQIDLNGVSLRFANLSEAILRRTDLRHADLRGAILRHADLNGAILRSANLFSANLIFADLRYADLNGANLGYADLRYAFLSNANLFSADLGHAELSEAILNGTNLGYAQLWHTIFGDVDLSTVTGLETVRYLGPSTVGIDTIYHSQGKIPEAFLKGAGVPDSFIDYSRSLAGKPIDYSSCFISYSNKDESFAKRLYADLQSNHVRCWFAPHDMRIGDAIGPRIDESIRLHDKLLLVLSESSLASAWVKKEVETAFKKESQQQKLVLFPVRLDDTVMHTPQAWAADLRCMRHIGDFRQWKDHDEYQTAFARLLRDLQTQ